MRHTHTRRLQHFKPIEWKLCQHATGAKSAQGTILTIIKGIRVLGVTLFESGYVSGAFDYYSTSEN